MKNKDISVTEFKAHCLELIGNVNKEKVSITLTKHGKPCAQVIPINNDVEELFGCLKGTVTENGDILEPLDVIWDADHD